MGDFSADQGKAAMIVGGAISLIPVVDQVMDVRDVSGMVFRISKVGPAKATKDDWMDAALAAFGCIPEVGSLFKTIVKPLRKLRKEAGPLAGGNVMIEAMLAKSKGAAIKFMKTFDWAQNTQLAIVSAIAALDSCVAMLDELSREHWWLSPELQYTARDMKPQVEALRGPLKSGITQGSAALQEMIRELLGEDALMVAQNVAYAATVIGNPAAKHNHAKGEGKANSVPARAKTHGDTPSPGRGMEHKPQEKSNRQVAKEGSGKAQNATRKIEDSLSEISFVWKGLIGEHLADYYHMCHYLKADSSWPHGDYRAKWKHEFPRIIHEKKDLRRPKELIPEDIGRVTTSGIDTIWQISAEEFHFVEAKLSYSGGAVYGLGHKRMKAAKGSRIPPAPDTLTSRQLALWCLLSEPRSGTQMSKDWVRDHISNSDARNLENLQNRWVYLFLIAPTVTDPFGNKYKAGEKRLTLTPAHGIDDHLRACAVLLAENKYENVREHDDHRPMHGVSEIFQAHEIDAIARRRRSISRKQSSDLHSEETASANQRKSNKMTKKKGSL
ncbi:hypothetical protein ACFFTM_18395 [Pseudoduganella plicata]|uniref:Uncharacterized protein n=1 Tax=Pseudoduganella plicata TaxID=321984 RepID=A0A4P7BFZ3_9BURK|nr:hypothetical protein [Pseudoduganella plicata]QBQ37696.1 hypothetical protein E1742_17085 [Pseudoduganella plicata]GGY92384.1 hypothetical protein GCM10007388_27160 [Pseudoduganella plicata]